MRIDWLADEGDERPRMPPRRLTPEEMARIERLSIEYAILVVMHEGSIRERVKLAQWRLRWWKAGDDLFHYGRNGKPAG